MATRVNHYAQKGFTLIELSIVLVIIGLIVGGVLVGQDLIRAAALRATISQIEKYNTAVNTFRSKYGALPGDLNANTATQFGFAARGSAAGQGDGNGVIEGSAGGLPEGYQQVGETLSFWGDLTVGNAAAPMNINMIDGSFPSDATGGNVTRVSITTANANTYLPPAKLGGGNSVYVYSTNGVNYFGIAPITTTTGYTNAFIAGMTVQQAYQIDMKVDDGIPASGNVTATWTSGNGTTNTPAENAAAPTVNAASPDSAATCYNNTTTAGLYSINTSGGANVNCALSFRFQ